MKRILAWAALIAMFILIIATVIAGLTGAPTNILLALLFCEIAIPGSAYAFIIITKQIRKLNNADEAQPENKKTLDNADKSSAKPESEEDKNDVVGTLTGKYDT